MSIVHDIERKLREIWDFATSIPEKIDLKLYATVFFFLGIFFLLVALPIFTVVALAFFVLILLIINAKEIPADAIKWIAFIVLVALALIALRVYNINLFG